MCFEKHGYFFSFQLRHGHLCFSPFHNAPESIIFATNFTIKLVQIHLWEKKLNRACLSNIINILLPTSIFYMQLYERE